MIRSPLLDGLLARGIPSPVTILVYCGLWQKIDWFKCVKTTVHVGLFHCVKLNMFHI